MYNSNPFAMTMNERWEREQAEADAFDAEFPYWQEAEAASEDGRFVSEYDMENDEFEKAIEGMHLMDANEFAKYADAIQCEREMILDMEGWF